VDTVLAHRQRYLALTGRSHRSREDPTFGRHLAQVFFIFHF
jgi:hypothetical protein